jgi:hypothetical protein
MSLQPPLSNRDIDTLTKERYLSRKTWKDEVGDFLSLFWKPFFIAVILLAAASSGFVVSCQKQTQPQPQNSRFVFKDHTYDRQSEVRVVVVEDQSKDKKYIVFSRGLSVSVIESK